LINNIKTEEKVSKINLKRCKVIQFKKLLQCPTKYPNVLYNIALISIFILFSEVSQHKSIVEAASMAYSVI